MKGEKNRLNKLRHELRMWLTELLYDVFKRFEIFENFFYCQNSGKTSKSFSYNQRSVPHKYKIYEPRRSRDP